MNSVKFWVLVGLSSLTVVLTGVQVWFVEDVQELAAKVNQAGQNIQVGQASGNELKALAFKIYAAGHQAQDSRLLDVLTRHGVNVNVNQPPPSAPAANPSPAAPSTPMAPGTIH